MNGGWQTNSRAVQQSHGNPDADGSVPPRKIEESHAQVEFLSAPLLTAAVPTFA